MSKPNWLRWLDLPGGQWLGAFTATMLGLSVYATIVEKDVPAGAVAAYAAALTGFAAHSISKVVKRGKDEGGASPVGFGLNEGRDGD